MGRVSWKRKGPRREARVISKLKTWAEKGFPLPSPQKRRSKEGKAERGKLERGFRRETSGARYHRGQGKSTFQLWSTTVNAVKRSSEKSPRSVYGGTPKKVSVQLGESRVNGGKRQLTVN